MNVKEWYTTTYPEDELGNELNEISFKDLIVRFYNKEDFYEIVGDSADTVIRERIFEKISNILEITYDEVYNFWIE